MKYKSYSSTDKFEIDKKEQELIDRGLEKVNPLIKKKKNQYSRSEARRGESFEGQLLYTIKWCYAD